MLYVRVSCFVVRGCVVSRRYINVFNCDMFSVVNVYLDNLKFCVMCINGRRYFCHSECNAVYNECNEPTSGLVQPIGTLGFLNCDDICMCVVNKKFELLDIFIPFMLTCSMMRFLALLLLGMCSCVVSVIMWWSLVCL